MSKTNAGQGGTKYPWVQWFQRKKEFELIRGEHFKCLPHSMAQQMRNAAYRHGYRVSISIGKGLLKVRVVSRSI